MQRNIVLIYPPNEYRASGSAAGSDIPLSLLYLSGAARTHCDDIAIFDFNVAGNSFEKLQNLIAALDPTLIGINCLFSGVFHAVLDISNKIKASFPNQKIVIGGMHPTIFGHEIRDAHLLMRLF